MSLVGVFPAGGVPLFSHSSVVNHLDEQQANLDSVQETLSSLFNLDQEAFTDVLYVLSYHVMCHVTVNANGYVSLIGGTLAYAVCVWTGFSHSH